MRRALRLIFVVALLAGSPTLSSADDRASLCARVARIQITSFEAGYQSEDRLNPMVIGYDAGSGGWYIIASTTMSASAGDGVTWVLAGEGKRLQPTPDSGLRRSDAGMIERYLVPTLFAQRLCEMPEAQVTVTRDGEWLVGEVMLTGGSRASIIKPLPGGVQAKPSPYRFWVGPSGLVGRMQIGSGPIVDIQYANPAKPWLATSFSYGSTVLKLARVDPLPPALAGAIRPEAVERRSRQPWRVPQQQTILITSSSDPAVVAQLMANSTNTTPAPMSLPPPTSGVVPVAHPGLPVGAVGSSSIPITRAPTIDDVRASPQNASVLKVGAFERYQPALAWCGAVFLVAGLLGVARRRWSAGT